MPLQGRPLRSTLKSHHAEIEEGGLHGDPRIGKNHFIDQDLRVASFHSRGGVPQDLLTGLVGPVVEDLAEIVDFCSYVTHFSQQDFMKERGAGGIYLLQAGV